MQYNKEQYDKRFSRTAVGSGYGLPIDLVVKVLAFKSSGTVLDLGAGDGRHAIYLAQQGFTVTAVDISETGLAKVQREAMDKNLPVTTEIADLNTWSINKQYDVIISIVTLQHLQYESALCLLRDMKTHTRPGGLNVITIMTKSSDRYFTDLTDDPESFYPDNFWLREFYSDWNIIESNFFGGTVVDTPPIMPQHNFGERLFAKKP